MTQLIIKIIIKSAAILFIGGLMMHLSACVSTSYTDINGVERIYHGFSLQVDKSTQEVRNIRYSYGVLDGDNKLIPTAFPPLPLFVYSLMMPVPDYFEIKWETLDGMSHQSKVPIKGHLPASVKNKTVSFVIMYDSVQGYLERYTPTGIERTRFY